MTPGESLPTAQQVNHGSRVNFVFTKICHLHFYVQSIKLQCKVIFPSSIDSTPVKIQMKVCSTSTHALQVFSRNNNTRSYFLSPLESREVP